MSIIRAMVGLHRGIVRKPALIVLEIQNLGHGSSDLERLFRLDVPVVVLTGVYEDRQVLEKWNCAAVMRRPFTIGQVVETVERLVTR